MRKLHARDQARNRFRLHSPARAVSVYDGRSCLGSISLAENGEASAFNPSGAWLGVFPNLKGALATFPANKPERAV
jgi:hypothetical protein